MDASLSEQLTTFEPASQRWPRHYQAGDTLFYSGQPCEELYVIANGHVRLSQLTQDGQERLTDIAGPDDLLGAECLGARARYQSEARCLDDSLIYPLPVESLETLLSRSPELALSVCRHLSAQSSGFQARLSRSSQPALVRIGKALAHFARRFSQRQNGDWVRLEPDLKQEDLAAYVGTSRVTVTQNLNVLRDEELLSGTRGQYWLRLEVLEHYLDNLA